MAAERVGLAVVGESGPDPRIGMTSKQLLRSDSSVLQAVLIDGGSALNIIFAKTLEDKGFDMTKLVPSDQAFYGIISGAGSTPVGKVTLPVTFGTRDNYRTESIIFEVAPFETSYHAILGRPALASFMAIPNHMYLLLKMPAPNGVLSIRSDI
ncbi:uncharacterized protein LOC120647956 [Panicum virgatum]|uniref:uncharacterized protein LOC120647956 n=1 Tax=Panicum virgatum TaxID=38727 RepID=UPI0019D64ACE|nr:uncharacterized protein LOC120647956 [Panicum virgatum]